MYISKILCNINYLFLQISKNKPDSCLKSYISKSKLIKKLFF